MTEKQRQSQQEHSGYDPDELVTVNIFGDGERYRGDVFVAVNGKSWAIRRNTDVKIPRYAAQVLEQSRQQDQETIRLIHRESRRLKEIAAE